MSDNSILNTARYSSNTDEWYTTYETIDEEITNYKDHFKGKVVLCNCDDPFESNFSYYFLKNFNCLGLRKLICTSYGDSKIDSITGNIQMELPLTDENGNPLSSKKGCVLSVSSMPGEKGKVIEDATIAMVLRKKGVVKKLKGDGDFRSEECVEFLKQCDICCTNPPFSLFAQLFSLLSKYHKQYLLIGNQNAITYKEIFPCIVRNESWVGYRFGDMSFRVPNDTEPRKTRFWIDADGQKWRSLGNAMWLTNMDIPKRHQLLKLTQVYDPKIYPKYDNTDVINVKRLSEIPSDYEGVMGVPITFLKYYNENQFEIVGEANHGSDNEYDFFKPIINGKQLFKRILIKRRQNRIRDFRILDLFCGAGGLSYGLEENCHFETEVALDNDEKAMVTFKNNFPQAYALVGDITDQTVKDKIIKECKDRQVNMIVGGPPCQGFSLKGKKLGLDDPRNFLFNEYLYFVEVIQPAVFVIENVKALLSTSAGWFKDQIVSRVNKMGYSVEYGVLTASDFGVPQARQRAIFICSKVGRIKLPSPTCKRPITVKQAISDLDYLESGEGSFEQPYITEAMSDYQVLMRKNSTKLFNHVASKHAQIAIEKLKMIPPECGKEHLPKEMLGNQKFTGTWGRLKWDNVSPTIDTRFDAASNGTNNHPVRNRSITPREAARIQSFPDCFVFYGLRREISRQIGNAVPPLLAKAIADQIYNSIGENDA